MTDNASYDSDEDLTDEELSAIWDRASAVELTAPINSQAQSYEFVITPAPEDSTNRASVGSLLVVRRKVSPVGGPRVTSSAGSTSLA